MNLKQKANEIITKAGRWLNTPGNDRIWKPAAGALVVALVVTTALLSRYYYKAWEAESAIDALRDVRENAGAADTGPSRETDVTQTVITDPLDTNPILPVYRDLYAQNSDLAGWIYIEDTSIDYPVMQTPDEPEYYLDKAFDQKENAHGLPFADAVCNLNEEGSNIIIYGHNMQSGLIFADLLKYADQSYWEAHPVISFDTLYETREYEITSVFLSHVPSDIPYSFVSPESKDAVESVLAQAKALSLYETGVSAQYGDDFLTLSTCDYSTDGGRLVIMARRVA